MTKFRYVYQHEETDRMLVRYYSLDEIEEGILGEKRWVLVSRNPFTGLVDKNGVEIYEGDLVKRVNADGYQEVRFIEGGFMPFRAISDDGRAMFRVYEFEIIGNVYENPELVCNCACHTEKYKNAPVDVKMKPMGCEHCRYG